MWLCRAQLCTRGRHGGALSTHIVSSGSGSLSTYILANSHHAPGKTPVAVIYGVSEVQGMCEQLRVATDPPWAGAGSTSMVIQRQHAQKKLACNDKSRCCCLCLTVQQRAAEITKQCVMVCVCCRLLSVHSHVRSMPHLQIVWQLGASSVSGVHGHLQGWKSMSQISSRVRCASR